MHRTTRVRLGVVVVSAGLLLWACGGGGGGGDDGGGVDTTPSAEITARSMTDAVAAMDTYVPGCSDGVTAGRAALANPPTALGATVKTVLQFLSKERALRAARGLADVHSGDCPGNGGTLTNSFDHSSGTDTGSYVFDNYCTVDSATGEETTINGTLSYVDVGQPTDFGPERVQLTVNTGSSGLRTQSSEGDDSTLSLSGLTYTVGTVGAAPTAASPDVLSISSLSTKDNTPGGHTELITGFVMATSETGTNTEFEVRSGRLTTQEHGTVDLATAANGPLVMDANGDLVGGTLLVTGAGGDTAEFVVNPANPNGFEITVDGTPLATNLDCTEFFGSGL